MLLYGTTIAYKKPYIYVYVFSEKIRITTCSICNPFLKRQIRSIQQEIFNMY